MSIYLPVGKMYPRIKCFSSSHRHLMNLPLKLSVSRLYSSQDNVNNNISSSSTKQHYDIIIAGGGMVGCAMACKLSTEPALRGISILLLEGGPRKEYDLDAKQNVPNKSYSNRVSLISNSNVQLLQSIGAWEIIKHVGGCNAIKEMRIWNCGGGRNGGVNNVLTLDNENDLGYIVENDTILGALYKQIHNDQNITVLYDSRVNQCSLPNTSKELATVKVANGDTTFETNLLIGSDGYGSKVRSAINDQQYINWEYGQRAVVATLDVQSIEDDVFKGHVAWQKFAELGPVALLPLDNQKCSLVWTTSFEEAQRLVGLNDNEFIKTLNGVLMEEKESNNSSLLLADDLVRIVSTVLNKCCKSSDKNYQNKTIKFTPPIVTGVTQGSRASFPLGFGHACQYVGHRVALVGDAAHRVHPLAGLGVNLGFSDVTKLSDQLGKSALIGSDFGDLNTLLNYQTAAQRHNVPFMLGIDGIQKVYGNNNLMPFAISALVRNMGFVVCQSVSSMKKLLINKAYGWPL